MTETLVSHQRAGAEAPAADTRTERELLRMLRKPQIGAEEDAQKQNGFRRGVVWALMLLLLIPLFAGLAGGTAFADEEDPGEDDESSEVEEALGDFSFYSMSAQMAGLFSDSTSPSGNIYGVSSGEADPDNLSEAETSLINQIRRNAGSAGSFVGYLDPSIIDDGISTWFMSQLSSSSAAITYDSLRISTAVSGDGVVEVNNDYQGFYNYAIYGAALNDLGFAETSMGMSFGSFTNAVTGGLLWFVWIISYIVNFVFWLFVQILIALNPFRWFYEGVHSISPELADGMTGGRGAETDITIGLPDNAATGDNLNIQIPDALQGLVSWVGSWYSILYAMSWAVMVPLFLGVFIFGLLMYKKMDRGSATKKLLVRLFFIVFGVPLMGSMYSATLDSMSEGLNPTSSGTTRVVLSTYVDFENWANQHRLAIPEQATIEWDRDSNSVTASTLANMRQNALHINSLTHEEFTPLSSSTPDGFGEDDTQEDWSQAQAEGMSEGESATEDHWSIVNSLIWRSIRMDHTTASGFETAVKARASASASAGRGGVDQEQLIAFFEQAEDGDGESDTGRALHENPLLAVSNGDGLRTHYQNNNGVNLIAFRTDNVGTNYCTDMQAWNSSGYPRACNMAPLAMFNFLNTSFDSTSMTIYSSGNVASQYTRQTYNSVNPVGTGPMRWMVLANSIALIASFILIGLLYAFAMLFGAFKRTFQVIGSIPFAVLGAMGGISKVMIYTLALIIQTLGTVFLYMFVVEFLVSLPAIIEGPFAMLLGWGIFQWIPGPIVFILTALLSTVAVIVFTIMAVKVRGSVMKALEEAVQKLVEKLTGSSAGASSGPGPLGRAAQGAAAGAGAGMGAAAANRAMTSGGNRFGGGGKRANASGTNPKGPVTDGVPKPGQGSGPNGQLTAAEQAKAVEAAGGSADPNAENYDPRHPDAPDYDGSVDGAPEAASEDGSGEEYGGQGMTQASSEMGHASDDVAEGRRLEKTGLSEDGNGHAVEPGAAGADGGQGDGSETFDQTADRVDSDVESALHDERSVSEQGRDLAASTGDQAKGVGHAALGNEEKAAEQGERAEERVTGESSHTEGAASEGSDRHDVEAGQDAQSDRSTEEQRAEQERAERERSEQESREAQTAGSDRHDVQAGQDQAGRDSSSESATADSQREVQAGENRASNQSELQSQSTDSQSTESQRDAASGPQAAGQDAASTREGDQLSQTASQNASVDARSQAHGGDQRASLNQQGDVSQSADTTNADQRVAQQQDVDQRSQQSPATGAAGAAGAVPAKGGGAPRRSGNGAPGTSGAPQAAAAAAGQTGGPKGAPQAPQSKDGGKPAKGQPEAKPGRTRAAAEGGTKGAVKGAAGGAAVGATAGVVGGPKGMAAGAAKGATVGAKYGAKTGATSGALKRDTSGNLNPLKVGKKASKRPKAAGKQSGRKPAPQPPAGQRGPAQAQPPAPRPAPKQGPGQPKGPGPAERPKGDES